MGGLHLVEQLWIVTFVPMGSLGDEAQPEKSATPAMAASVIVTPNESPTTISLSSFIFDSLVPNLARRHYHIS
jgi:hypothetical protein